MVFIERLPLDSRFIYVCRSQNGFPLYTSDNITKVVEFIDSYFEKLNTQKSS